MEVITEVALEVFLIMLANIDSVLESFSILAATLGVAMMLILLLIVGIDECDITKVFSTYRFVLKYEVLV